MIKKTSLFLLFLLLFFSAFGCSNKIDQNDGTTIKNDTNINDDTTIIDSCSIVIYFSRTNNTKKIEFKEIVSHKNYEKWLKEIAAFANTDGRKVFFGVDDDENLVGLTKEQVKTKYYISMICVIKKYIPC